MISGSAFSSSVSRSDDEEEEEDTSQEAVLQADTMKDARRLYPWTKDQRQAVERLSEGLQGGWSREVQAVAVHEFIQAVIYQNVRGDNFCSPMLHFLAVLGIDEEMGRLRKANDFLYVLAGIVYCVRVLTVEDILPSTSRQL